jgi:hypothetical protein
MVNGAKRAVVVAWLHGECNCREVPSITDRQREAASYRRWLLERRDLERLGIPQTVKAHCDVLRQKLASVAGASSHRVPESDRRGPLQSLDPGGRGLTRQRPAARQAERY